MRRLTLQRVGEAARVRASASSFRQEGGGRKEAHCLTTPPPELSCPSRKTSRGVKAQPHASHPGKEQMLSVFHVEAKKLASWPPWLFPSVWEFLLQPSFQKPCPYLHLPAAGVTSAQV